MHPPSSLFTPGLDSICSSTTQGLFYYLGAVLLKTEDTAVHFKYIQAAAKVGNLAEVERVTREDNFYDAEQVPPARPPRGEAGRERGVVLVCAH